MYIKPLSTIIYSHCITQHSFAEELQLQMYRCTDVQIYRCIQIYMYTFPDKIFELLHSMQSCISDVKAWATENMLRFNDNKTELMLVTSKN